jgi:SAM-dependent methyltransferase
MSSPGESSPADRAGQPDEAADREVSAARSRILTDPAYLTNVQYRTPQNLEARRSIYAYQQPWVDVIGTVLDLAGLDGHETVADVGCGNGVYLAELARRGHAGRVLGVDLSPGMLAAARGGAPEVRLLAGDAAALPLVDSVADVMLAPHMLNHVPDRVAAVREFRRVTRPGGAALVVLNGTDHLAELQDLVIGAAAGDRWGLTADDVRADYQRLTLDAGEELLSQVFGSVRRHDLVAELVVPGPEPVGAYVASMRVTQAMSDPVAFAAAVTARVPLGPDGSFRIRTHLGVLLCS